ncbi:MAG: baseplate hub protein [Elusimicrobiaceae bacterium]
MNNIFDKNHLPERYVRVELYCTVAFNTQTGKYERIKPESYGVFENIQAEFNITKTRGAMIDKADITLYGLSAAKRNNIVSLAVDNYSYGVNGRLGYLRKRYGIAIYGGYKDYNPALLYSGDIFQATVISTAPDIGIKIEGKTGFYSRAISAEKVELKGGDFKTLCGQACQALNLKLRYLAKRNIQIDAFAYSGKAFWLVNKLQEIDKKVIIKCDDIFMTVTDLPKEEDAKGDITVISQNTGMIGLPQPSPYGMNVTTLLNPRLQPGQWIDVKSDIIPQYNGKYNISILTHSGSLRGNNFYTRLQCTKFSGIIEDEK